MQYHLDTIPVWEVMELDAQCPLCELYRRNEEKEIERSLGGSVMEPDTRIRVNERGICAKHHAQLFMMQNRLGHALLTDSHTKELLKKLDSAQKLIPSKDAKGGLFGGRRDGLDALIGELDKLSTSCVVCEALVEHMNRYYYTFMHLWKNDKAFRQKWESSKGVCVPHAAELMRQAQKHLNASQQRDFAQSTMQLVRDQLAQDEKDLEWFTLKFDYRNQDKPWGNSKNALERTINRLRGRCVGAEEKK